MSEFRHIPPSLHLFFFFNVALLSVLFISNQVVFVPSHLLGFLGCFSYAGTSFNFKHTCGMLDLQTAEFLKLKPTMYAKLDTDEQVNWAESEQFLS